MRMADNNPMGRLFLLGCTLALVGTTFAPGAFAYKSPSPAPLKKIDDIKLGHTDIKKGMCYFTSYSQ